MNHNEENHDWNIICLHKKYVDVDEFEKILHDIDPKTLPLETISAFKKELKVKAYYNALARKEEYTDSIIEGYSILNLELSDRLTIKERAIDNKYLTLIEDIARYIERGTQEFGKHSSYEEKSGLLQYCFSKSTDIIESHINVKDFSPAIIYEKRKQVIIEELGDVYNKITTVDFQTESENYVKNTFHDVRELYLDYELANRKIQNYKPTKSNSDKPKYNVYKAIKDLLAVNQNITEGTRKQIEESTKLFLSVSAYPN